MATECHAETIHAAIRLAEAVEKFLTEPTITLYQQMKMRDGMRDALVTFREVIATAA